ncbi:uncharacterized protein LOC110899604 isoform X2 [Helianthus annuus]|nr:uncharacterized protein LOC110899604 isoform X2 [Helianthus annuus]
MRGCSIVAISEGMQYFVVIIVRISEGMQYFLTPNAWHPMNQQGMAGNVLNECIKNTKNIAHKMVILVFIGHLLLAVYERVPQRVRDQTRMIYLENLHLDHVK